MGINLRTPVCVSCLFAFRLLPAGRPVEARCEENQEMEARSEGEKGRGECVAMGLKSRAME